MTTFLRSAHLSLVAYAALAIILLLAFAAEELKPCAEKQGREAPDRRPAKTLRQPLPCPRRFNS